MRQSKLSATFKISRILLTGIILALGGALVFAQASPPLAAVTGGQVTLYGLGNLTQVTQGAFSQFADLTWSPDGQHLAFTMYDESYNLALMLTDRAGSAPVVLAQGVSYLPVTFAADSSRIIYSVQGSQEEIESPPGGTPVIPMRLFAQGLSPDAQREQIGEIGFGVGCGGGSPYPMDRVYNAEAGFGGSALILARTPHGILHSTNCAGGGLALLDTASGESVVIGEGLSRASLSPDGTRVAALQGGRIVIVDLSTRETTPVAVQSAPDQIAWGDASTLYYSTRSLLDEALPLSDEERQVLASVLGMDNLPQYSVAIFRRDLSGAESQVYSGHGWAVGRMFASGSDLYFSLIPNGETWIEALASGQFDLTTREGFLREQQTVAPTLFRLSPDGAAVEVAQDIGQATPHPSAR